MLFRVVCPMRRGGSRFPPFVQRIPADVHDEATGNRLAIPLGESFVFITPGKGAKGPSASRSAPQNAARSGHVRHPTPRAGTSNATARNLVREMSR